MFKTAIAFCCGFLVFSTSFAQSHCLDKSEMEISQTTTYGPCKLVEPLELRTKNLYCEGNFLDQWVYWAGKYEKKEKSVSKVLVQITNTCSNQVIKSAVETRATEKIIGYYIADTRSLYPAAYGWYVFRYSDKVDHIKATECDSFSEGMKKNERDELLSDYDAKQAFERERLNCEMD
ncbi:MAG: hypothetical protein ACAH59_06275 [Pseudobdellovibrionaceae bacterium]